MNIVDDIIAYESGELDGEETIALFQRLVDTGMAWQLQGSYGRTAHDLIVQGLVTLPLATCKSCGHVKDHEACNGRIE